MARSAKHKKHLRTKGTSPRQGRRSQPAKAALIIFAKSPIPGSVKTRLCPPLSPDEAATLHGSLVLDTLERTRQLPEFDRFLACAPSKQHPFFQALGARQRIELWEQISEEDLGQRMNHAFCEAFSRNYSFVVMIGSDLPTIGKTIPLQALQMLSDQDIVIGPSEDGGYYLIGLKQPAPELFTEIPWSTHHVTTLTRQKADHLGCSLSLLDQQRDLDTPEDLHYYIKESQDTLRQTVSSRTTQVLKTLGTRLVNRE